MLRNPDGDSGYAYTQRFGNVVSCDGIEKHWVVLIEWSRCKKMNCRLLKDVCEYVKVVIDLPKTSIAREFESIHAMGIMTVVQVIHR